ncbi:MAG: hypothetical protein K0S47_3796 [Herbinix sp.]|jgi:hypothetical protein|nr:hypothetical protein [Herbinix sp.]
MEFGIRSIESGWFNWYIQDKVQKVEMTASRYDNEDFVKKFLVNLTDIIRHRQENIFSFFSEPEYVTIKMKVEDNDMFTMEIACSDSEIHSTGDITTCTEIYNKFSISMFQLRTEFVPTIIKSFHYYQRSHLMLDCYEENWTIAIGEKDSENFMFPFNELQELHQTASDIRIK